MHDFKQKTHHRCRQRAFKKHQAERGGFEPPVRFDPHTAFPVPHNRPLCHLSEYFKSLFVFILRLQILLLFYRNCHLSNYLSKIGSRLCGILSTASLIVCGTGHVGKRMSLDRHRG